MSAPGLLSVSCVSYLAAAHTLNAVDQLPALTRSIKGYRPVGSDVLVLQNS